jgi:hypothetical protein
MSGRGHPAAMACSVGDTCYTVQKQKMPGRWSRLRGQACWVEGGSPSGGLIRRQGGRKSLSVSGAGLAQPADFQHGAFRLELTGGGDGADGAAHILVIDVGSLTAFVAHQEDAVMRAARVGVG